MSSVAATGPKSQPIVWNRAAIAGVMVHGLHWSQFLDSLRFLTLAFICFPTAPAALQAADERLPLAQTSLDRRPVAGQAQSPPAVAHWSGLASPSRSTRRQGIAGVSPCCRGRSGMGTRAQA